MKSNRYYVYVLHDWCGIPRWVGAGTGYRWSRSRHKGDTNAAKDAFLEETKAKIGRIPVQIIQEDLSRKAAHKLEVELIAKIGRMPDGPLTNMAIGGMGPNGVVRSDSFRAKLSATITGRKLSADHAAAIARASTGRKQSEEVKARKNAKLRGRKRTPEQRERIAVAARARKPRGPHSEETIEKMRAAAKAAWAKGRPLAAKGADGKFTSGGRDGGQDGTLLLEFIATGDRAFP